MAKNADLKTGPTDASVDDFLAAIADDGRRADARAVCDLLAAQSGRPPRMWGTSIGDLLGRLGNHTTGKGCVYLKRLSDVDNDVLTELVARSIGNVRGR